MRAPLMPRIFFYISVLAIAVFVIILMRYQAVPVPYTNLVLQDVVSENGIDNVNNSRNNTALKYILQYTNPQSVPFVYMGVGQTGFLSNNCPFTNCIVTGDKNYLNDITMFDVIAFAGTEIVYRPSSFLPTKRSQHQKYVFGTIESSHYYPICSNRLDGFFNWTWTFRLDSEVRWGYMDIRDKNDKLVGPNKVMHWMKVEDMDPVEDSLKEKFKSKTIAGAWFVSNCNDRSGRLKFARTLQEELKKYHLVLDIFGGCGTKQCPTNKHNECMKMVDKSYYFYMSFENSFSEDYVTEKLLQALKIDVVPVVYGGANYTRFMPDGIYLNARELGPEKLAAKMDELIRNPEEYASYFKWKKYYTYWSKHDRPETNEYCKMCELLNNEEKLRETTVVQNFREWWDSPKQC